MSERFSVSRGMLLFWSSVMPLCGIQCWDLVHREVPFPIVWEPYKPVEPLWVQILAIIMSSFRFLSLTRFFVHADNSPCCLMVIWALFLLGLSPFVSDRTENDTTLRIVPSVLERHRAKYRLFWRNPNIRTISFVQLCWNWLAWKTSSFCKRSRINV